MSDLSAEPCFDAALIPITFLTSSLKELSGPQVKIFCACLPRREGKANKWKKLFTVKEIARATSLSTPSVYGGLGWLMKNGLIDEYTDWKEEEYYFAVRE